MYDTDKLRGRIVEKFRSQKAFSEACGRSLSFISQYMCGKKYLTQNDIYKWAELLEIPGDEIDDYFFKRKVHGIELGENSEEDAGCQRAI